MTTEIVYIWPGLELVELTLELQARHGSASAYSFRHVETK